MKNKSLKKGKVISIVGNKSIKVQIVTRKPHPVYKKIIKKSINYIVHDENSSSQIGDLVSFVECRPLSKRKSFLLVGNES